jgi:hypothetical protein
VHISNPSSVNPDLCLQSVIKQLGEGLIWAGLTLGAREATGTTRRFPPKPIVSGNSDKDSGRLIELHEEDLIIWEDGWMPCKSFKACLLGGLV